MNREQIIKALEHCINDDFCDECPIGVSKCHITEQSLSIIKELTEENEKLGAENEHLNLVVDGKLKCTSSLEKKVLKLTEENEALQKELIATQEKADKEYYELALEIDKVQSENELVKKFCGVDSNAVETFREYVCNRINMAKALTARKMQYMIQARCIKGGIYPAFVARTIEEVAKEMVEECYESTT